MRIMQCYKFGRLLLTLQILDFTGGNEHINLQGTG